LQVTDNKRAKCILRQAVRRVQAWSMTILRGFTYETRLPSRQGGAGAPQREK
jgi:hypothetical protein